MSVYPDLPGLDADEIDRAVQHIAESLYEGTAEFMFGAGMSVASGVPSGRALARKLLDHFFPSAAENRPTENEFVDLLDSYPFEALVQGVQLGLGSRERLTKALKKEIEGKNPTPSPAHKLFGQLCHWDGAEGVSRIFTTNFDNLLEQQLDAGCAPITEANVHEQRRIQSDGKIPIIHLHGLLDEKYEVTEQDVFDDAFRVVASDLRAALITAESFVFVGYSMSDPDFRRIYHLYRADISTRGKASKRTYVVSPATPASYRLGKVVWETRGAVWIPLSAEAFFAQLKVFMEGRVEDTIRNSICAKYGISPDDDAAFEALVEKTSDILSIERRAAIRFLQQAHPRSGV